MNRREFLAASGAATLLPVAALAASGTEATPEEVLQALDRGETVFVDFYASWCTTCRAQERQIKALLAENPAYGEAISFLSIDWTEHGRSDLANSLNVPRRSTLIVLKGDEEYGRLVAATSRAQIQELMDTALRAATS